MEYKCNRATIDMVTSFVSFLTGVMVGIYIYIHVDLLINKFQLRTHRRPYFIGSWIEGWPHWTRNRYLTWAGLKTLHLIDVFVGYTILCMLGSSTKCYKTHSIVIFGKDMIIKLLQAVGYLSHSNDGIGGSNYWVPYILDTSRGIVKLDRKLYGYNMNIK